MMTCPHFKPRSNCHPKVCRYWDDHNPHWPAQCKHPAVIFCPTRGHKFPLPTIADLSGKFPDFTGDLSTEEFIQWIRGDSDDDGYPD